MTRDEWQRKHDRMQRPAVAACHPDQPHFALGLCAKCYWTQRNARRRAERLAAPASGRWVPGR